MADSEECAETKPDSKQPTGSSKRKRKQSIKRNIVLDDDTEFEVKKSKVEKSYSRKVKGEKKEKSNKHSDEPSSKAVESIDKETTCEPLVKDVGTEMDNVPSNPVHTQGGIKNEADNKKDGVKCDESNAAILPGSLDGQENKSASDEQECHESESQDSKKMAKARKKYVCNDCTEGGSAKVFPSKDKLKQHMLDCHKEFKEKFKRFLCTECTNEVWFPTKSKFVYHLGTKHPGVIKFICDICTETFKLKANYKIHMKSHNVVVLKKYTCEVCKGTFVNRAGFEAHKRRFPGPHIKQNCMHCGFSFSKEKHMKNHRCKTLLLREAEKRRNNTNPIPEVIVTIESKPNEEEEKLKQAASLELENAVKDVEVLLDKKLSTESTDESSLAQKQSGSDEDVETSKRVVVHRIIARRNQDPAVYRSVQVPNNQNVSESVVVQELRGIDFEGGTFITASSEQDQQFIVRDLNGHLVQGNQILQLDLNDVQPGEESQVYLADWNIVAPYVIKEKYP